MVKKQGDLAATIQRQKIQKLAGFGIKSEEKIAQGITLMQRASGRHLFGEILSFTETLVARLQRLSGVDRYCN